MKYIISPKLYLLFSFIILLMACSEDNVVVYPDTSDIPEKHDYLIKPALDGSIKAQMDIAYLYIDGDGVDIDNDKAIAWLQNPAKKGNDEAQFNLGVYYFNGAKNGKGEPYFKKSFFWSMKQAIKNDFQAQYNVAIMYDHGNGVKKDINEAFEWYLKSANNGHSKSMRNVSSFYLSGELGNKNVEKFIYWIKKAANNGEADAMISVGKLYIKGEHVQKDKVIAYQWIKLALRVAGSGSNQTLVKETLGILDNIRSTMTIKQIQQGDEWVSKKTGS